MNSSEKELLKNLCRSYISVHEIALSQEKFKGKDLDRIKASIHSSIENLVDVKRTEEEGEKLRKILYNPEVYCPSYKSGNSRSMAINDAGRELAEVIGEQVDLSG